LKSITIKAPAKINIGLNIISKRPDGYHNLETLFYPIHDLYDLLIFRESDSNLFKYQETESLPHEDNLVIKAKGLVEKRINKELPAEIELIKNIPIGAGLGGGSSDAAATLLALNEIFNLNFSDEELNEMAFELGSDVPLFLKPVPALGSSRGEILEPVELKINHPLLIVNPGIFISTGEAFSNITPGKSKNLFEIIKTGIEPDFNNWKLHVSNDFEPYILKNYSEVKEIKEKMEKAGTLFAQMSGTGSTVYGFFEGIEEAENTAARMPEDYLTFISYP
jgi:4-diphosphocytidyl-2-C-methyl-D-erythritol kinase